MALERSAIAPKSLVYALSVKGAHMTLYRVFAGSLSALLIMVYAGGANYWNKDYGWYQSLNRPSWQPPGYVIGTIWPYNFIVIGVALYVIITQARWQVSAITILIFATSIFFALRWSYFFYSVHDFKSAATSLLITAILTLPLLVVTFSYSWKVGVALLPYQVWIIAVAALAYSYADLNKSLT